MRKILHDPHVAKLDALQVAVFRHSVYTSDDAGVFVDATSSHQQSDLLSIPQCASFEEFKNVCTQWEAERLLHFQATALVPEENRLMQMLIRADAFPSACVWRGGYFETNREDDLLILRRLGSLGFVECVRDLGCRTHWVLTNDGLANMTVTQSLLNPMPMFSCRPDVDVVDRTTFELICTLLDSGWELCKLENEQRLSRRDSQYAQGSKMIFYLRNGSSPIGRQYLLALACDAKVFGFGHDAIAHRRGPAYYTALLDGPPKIAAPRGLLCVKDGYEEIHVGFDDPGGIVMGALQDMPKRATRRNHADDADGSMRKKHRRSTSAKAKPKDVAPSLIPLEDGPACEADCDSSSSSTSSASSPSARSSRSSKTRVAAPGTPDEPGEPPASPPPSPSPSSPPPSPLPPPTDACRTGSDRGAASMQTIMIVQIYESMRFRHEKSDEPSGSVIRSLLGVCRFGHFFVFIFETTG
jgi:hypothetical protein